MKVLNRLNIAGRTILTLDGNVLKTNASKVLINGKEYDFDIAYDMKNSIGIKEDITDVDNVEFA